MAMGYCAAQNLVPWIIKITPLNTLVTLGGTGGCTKHTWYQACMGHSDEVSVLCALPGSYGMAYIGALRCSTAERDAGGVSLNDFVLVLCLAIAGCANPDLGS